MEINQNTVGEYNLINKISDTETIINNKSFNQSCIVSNKNLIIDLNLTTVDDINETHIKQLLLSKPEIIILGSGITHKFPKINLLNPIAIKNIGFEVMSNKSAARTYNILIAEERNVACLLTIA